MTYTSPDCPALAAPSKQTLSTFVTNFRQHTGLPFETVIVTRIKCTNAAGQVTHFEVPASWGGTYTAGAGVASTAGAATRKLAFATIAIGHMARRLKAAGLDVVTQFFVVVPDGSTADEVAATVQATATSSSDSSSTSLADSLGEALGMPVQVQPPQQQVVNQQQVQALVR